MQTQEHIQEELRDLKIAFTSVQTQAWSMNIISKQTSLGASTLILHFMSLEI